MLTFPFSSSLNTFGLSAKSVRTTHTLVFANGVIRSECPSQDPRTTKTSPIYTDTPSTPIPSICSIITTNQFHLGITPISTHIPSSAESSYESPEFPPLACECHDNSIPNHHHFPPSPTKSASRCNASWRSEPVSTPDVTNGIGISL